MPLVQINLEIGPAVVSSDLGRVLAGRKWSPISKRAGMPWDRALAVRGEDQTEVGVAFLRVAAEGTSPRPQPVRIWSQRVVVKPVVPDCASLVERFRLPLCDLAARSAGRLSLE